MVSICVMTLILSTMSLALVAAIMQGFEEKTYEKLQGIHPDITLRSYRDPLDYEKILSTLTSEFGSEIIGITPFSLQQVLITDDQQQPQTIITLMAVDPGSLHSVIKLPLIQDNQTLATIVSGQTIVIGAPLAQQLSLLTHDTTQLWYLQEPITSKKATFDQVTVRIGGLFKTGVDEFDGRSAITSLSFFETLFPQEGIKQIGIKVAPHVATREFAQKLKERFALDAYRWQDLYPGLLAALVLEKYVAIAVLALMTLIASATLLALICMYLITKRRDIAILRALGLDEGSIKKTFMLIGVSITLFSTIIGLVLAALISFALEYGQLIKVPDVYYTSYVPAHLTLPMIVGILLLMTLLSCIATFVPIHLMRSIHVAHLLKFE